jgi:hypothetical protein
MRAIFFLTLQSKTVLNTELYSMNMGTVESLIRIIKFGEFCDDAFKELVGFLLGAKTR